VDQTILLALVGAALFGLLAIALILWRERTAGRPAHESPFGVSTEGMKVCPKCGRPNLWADATCLYCGAKLR
jgi:hypothetical protein